MSKNNNLPYIVPSPQTEVQEVFAAAQFTREFYDEIGLRSEHKKYCIWYRDTSVRHNQELEKMRGEFNLFAWFRRR
jgi:hypothetical protein